MSVLVGGMASMDRFQKREDIDPISRDLSREGSNESDESSGRARHLSPSSPLPHGIYDELLIIVVESNGVEITILAQRGY
jgi:hypothetical protein